LKRQRRNVQSLDGEVLPSAIKSARNDVDHRRCGATSRPLRRDVRRTHDDHVHPWRLEDGSVEVEAALHRVDDRARMVRQPMGRAKTVERGHGRVVKLLGARDEARLVAQRLGAESDVPETAEMAQVPAIRDAFRAPTVSQHGGDRIVIDARAPPGQHAVGRGDDHAVDPPTSGQGGGNTIGSNHSGSGERSPNG